MRYGILINNEEHSRLCLKYLFELGFRWGGTEDQKYYLFSESAPILLIYTKELTLWNGSADESFKNLTFLDLHTNNFLKHI